MALRELMKASELARGYLNQLVAETPAGLIESRENQLDAGNALPMGAMAESLGAAEAVLATETAKSATSLGSLERRLSARLQDWEEFLEAEEVLMIVEAFEQSYGALTAGIDTPAGPAIGAVEGRALEAEIQNEGELEEGVEVEEQGEVEDGYGVEKEGEGEGEEEGEVEEVGETEVDDRRSSTATRSSSATKSSSATATSMKSSMSGSNAKSTARSSTGETLYTGTSNSSVSTTSTSGSSTTRASSHTSAHSDIGTTTHTDTHTDTHSESDSQSHSRSHTHSHSQSGNQSRSGRSSVVSKSSGSESARHSGADESVASRAFSAACLKLEMLLKDEEKRQLLEGIIAIQPRLRHALSVCGPDLDCESDAASLKAAHSQSQSRTRRSKVSTAGDQGSAAKRTDAKDMGDKQEGKQARSSGSLENRTMSDYIKSRVEAEGELTLEQHLLATANLFGSSLISNAYVPLELTDPSKVLKVLNVL